MTKLITSLTFMFICLSVCHAQTPAISVPSLKLPALLLAQSNDIYGKTLTYLSKEGLRIELLGTHVVVIARAPTWQVMFYNTVNKKCVSLTKDAWMKHSQSTVYSGRDWDRTSMALSRPFTATKFGRQAHLFYVLGKKTSTGIQKGTKLHDAEYVVIEDLRMSPEAISIMQKCLSTPLSRGYPIELINRLPSQKVEPFRSGTTGDQTFLKTLSIEEKLVSRTIFDYPQNVVSAKMEADVINDAQKQRQNDDAFNAFVH